MPISGNPKKMAVDVAQGYQSFTHGSLRQYNTDDLKVLLFNLNLVLREIRAKQVALDDIDGLKEKNTKIRRLNHAVQIIQSFANLRGVKI
jgi:hypothetical protein